MFSRNRRSIGKTSFTIPSKIEFVRKSSAKILDAFAGHKVDEAKLFDVRLCVEEAIRNSIVHGNLTDEKRSVSISFWREDHKFVVEIEDEGKGFDWRALPDPTEKQHLTRNNGRGVYLIRHLMDEVAYSDRGNKVTMVKYL